MARAQARGQQDADVTVYENAMVAAAEGLAAMNAQIDAQYDKEFALIQLMEDSTERQNAMEALNAQYNENRRNAAAVRLCGAAQRCGSQGLGAGRYSAGGVRRGRPDAEASEYSAAAKPKSPPCWRT